MTDTGDHVYVRHETFLALQRIREDQSFQTYDHIIMELIKYRYKGKYDFGHPY